MQKELVRISKEFKSGLDELKGSSETYEEVLRRIIPRRFVTDWWGKPKSKGGK